MWIIERVVPQDNFTVQYNIDRWICLLVAWDTENLPKVMFNDLNQVPVDQISQYLDLDPWKERESIQPIS